MIKPPPVLWTVYGLGFKFSLKVSKYIEKSAIFYFG